MMARGIFYSLIGFLTVRPPQRRCLLYGTTGLRPLGPVPPQQVTSLNSWSDWRDNVVGVTFVGFGFIYFVLGLMCLSRHDKAPEVSLV